MRPKKCGRHTAGRWRSSLTVSITGDDGRYSYELCGGNHVSETAEIGPFMIMAEGSVSAGIRRVEAFTGHGALEQMQHNRAALQQLASQIGAPPEEAPRHLSHLQDELSQARKQIAALQRDLARREFDQLLGQIETLNGKQALIARMHGLNADLLRELGDVFRSRAASGVLVLGGVSEGKPQLLVAVTDDLVKAGVQAGTLIKPIAAVVGGGGGGRPTMAVAGGKDSARLTDALAEARRLLSQ